MANLPTELRVLTGAFDWHGQDTHALNVLKLSADRIDALEAALRDVIGMLDDPTGSEHVRDMRGATIIARSALKPKTPF
mgnify:CR=1 FL=1